MTIPIKLTKDKYRVTVAGHPTQPESFIEHREGPNDELRIIRSHVAYDSRWPWWRRFIANMRGRP